MENLIEVLKAILLGVVEGVTEWIPISSTGHMILVDEFLQLTMSDAFKEMFLVVIQLGAIFAVVVLYWNSIMPFSLKGGLSIKRDTFIMWVKIALACIPAVIYGLTLDEKLNEVFYNYQTVALALIVFGVLFIVIENANQGKSPRITAIADITYKTALILGLAQLVAAIFPGTSRSGATILCGLLLGLSRSTATEFTFYLAIPTMFGASALKLYKFGFDFTSLELVVLLTGTITAFFVSIVAIKFLMIYIKRHDFKIFGWYRIVLGSIVFLYFLLA
ncbi:MAG TPA: undecaprenyl-diphosphate phosphatase [Aggregatilinea sp.]|uniref:undecaprenyl-diphosphate phosphatase n=1 Tax=Aggregatilinea sp. TaxID=2806333 RepID=UPI002CECCA9D|nr:undecaprenyl-diphosphate phosphatase [Aggregatilinea sp.]HML20321.1 undecaprenyl-diphosphate phosphatase [Aggregatilinea sp.]